MQYLLLLSLLSVALAMPDYATKTPVELGGFCGGPRNAKCKDDLCCEARGPTPRLFSGICVPKPGDVGDECGGKHNYDRQCKTGLKCMVDGKVAHKRKGKCAKEEECAKEGEECQNKKCGTDLVCINKRPDLKDSKPKCCKKGDITTAGEGEACEGDTQSKCGEGFECKENNDKIKVCTKPEEKY